MLPPDVKDAARLIEWDVGQVTVAKYMARRRQPPSQGWKTFLCNHADGIASMDLRYWAVKRPEFITLLGSAVGSMHLPRIARSQQAGQQKAAIVELIAPAFMTLARRTAGDG